MFLGGFDQINQQSFLEKVVDTHYVQTRQEGR